MPVTHWAEKLKRKLLVDVSPQKLMKALKHSFHWEFCTQEDQLCFGSIVYIDGTKKRFYTNAVKNTIHFLCIKTDSCNMEPIPKENNFWKERYLEHSKEKGKTCMRQAPVNQIF